MGLFNFFKKLPAPEFEKISIRGRVAYGICCFENALEKFKVSGQGWNWLLENLWSFTSLPAKSIPLETGGVEFVLERWAEINSFMPYVEYFYDPYRYEDLCKYLDLYNETHITIDIYNLLKNAYKFNNKIISVIAGIVFDMGACELWAGLDNVSRDTLNRLQNLMDYMIENKIQLPEVEPFKKYEYAPKGIDAYSYGWGETFDGKQYSKFLK